ncbi:hypothetical protein Tco_0117112 [Tanacetum coccineum]
MPNVARFKRRFKKGSVNVDKTKNESNKRKFDGSHKNVENTVIGKSFVSVVKTSQMPIDKESHPHFRLFGRNYGIGLVELDGVPFHPGRVLLSNVLLLLGVIIDVDDYDESNLHSKRICILSKSDVEELLETLYESPDDQKDIPLGNPLVYTSLLNKENIALAQKVTEEDHSFVSSSRVFTPKEVLKRWAKLWVITWMGASRISLRSLNPKENLGLIDEFYVFERSRPRPKGQKIGKQELCDKNKVQLLWVLQNSDGSIDLSMCEVLAGYHSNLRYVHSDFVGKLGGSCAFEIPNLYGGVAFEIGLLLFIVEVLVEIRD